MRLKAVRGAWVSPVAMCPLSSIRKSAGSLGAGCSGEVPRPSLRRCCAKHCMSCRRQQRDALGCRCLYQESVHRCDVKILIRARTKRTEPRALDSGSRSTTQIQGPNPLGSASGLSPLRIFSRPYDRGRPHLRRPRSTQLPPQAIVAFRAIRRQRNEPPAKLRHDPRQIAK